MKKEKKEVEKKMVKEVKKVEKVEKKTIDKVIFTQDIKKAAKTLGVIVAFLATAASIFVFVFGIITSLKAANYTKEELLHDNFSVTFISNVSGNTIYDTENIIEGYGSKALFIIFDIVLPAIAFITIMILLIIFVKQLLEFVSGITKESELFTKEKLQTIEKLLCIIATALTVALVVFGRPSILIYAFISALLFIIIGLFDKCIEYKKNR